MTDPRVLLPHQVPAEAADELSAELRAQAPDLPIAVAADESETETLLDDVEGVVTWEFGPEWIERADDLEWIHVLSAGVDHFDLDAAESAGVRVTNASGIHAEPIAEQVVCYAFLFERGILADLRRQPSRTWERHDGEEISDKTIGIVGVGAIGSRVAERLGAFGATTIGTKRDPTTGGDGVDELYGAQDLDVVLDRSDYLVIACPLTDETEGMIGEAELAALDDEAVLVNIARGEIVDEDALVDALEADELGGAALDAFAEEPLPEDSPLWTMDDVVVTPHVSGTSQFLTDRNAALVVENWAALQAGEALTNRVV
ncbi:phosphoglycerate dehydrogenase [Salinarchaeum sp. Harcht-Bsk1]|uniref:D-2-hydroxyacid dehydrogenase n=1 Tax=Salinarchaeum sp. Harcht-Bsk1 TaxID=1333523 RepID=UPI000342477C|nr:D-2-hydroxyacid dehydrogenase [Salinarchaeum sp. Harcht-Bsk1]AGN02487.1 phosphoglycerate dehydrogenase [Salinarchaeum sp. Harcht-Bsk1]